MNRRDELLEMIPEDSRQLVIDVVEQLAFLEDQMDALRKLPFIEVHPKNPMKQRSTPAAKMYKEFFQQYSNGVKLLEAVIYRDKRLEGEEVEESPLRKWFNDHAH